MHNNQHNNGRGGVAIGGIGAGSGGPEGASTGLIETAQDVAERMGYDTTTANAYEATAERVVTARYSVFDLPSGAASAHERMSARRDPLRNASLSDADLALLASFRAS